MSLIIKGMNMPKSCHDCAMRYIAIGYDFECVFTNDHVGDCIERRLANCPLEEVHTPHGRLIDANELSISVLKAMNNGDDSVIGLIDKSPTIIEAEE